MNVRTLIAAGSLLAVPAVMHGQQRATPTIVTVAQLPPTCTAGQPFIVTDGNAADDCATGTGSTAVLCTCDAGGSSYSATGGGGVGAAVDAGEITAAAIDGDDLNSNIAGRSLTLTAAAPDTLDADAELYTRGFSYWCENCTTADDGDMQHKLVNASTLVRVSCSTNANSATIALYERAENAPNTGTTNLMTSTLVCNSDTTADATTSFADSAIAADSVVALGISSETLGATDHVRVFVEYTVND